ncbi:MSC_0618 family F1-like ATPase beta subunit [Mycoplasma phocimorsus]|uniref:F0F1 ATP synthase subunit beta n=1 Tax=Mycoplasma phocimorsus TaxID=3045839 RepID=A0AAJ1PQN1_9MOLU|nr:F0F1 ATP synthase subunit beta [Mycoplasma phocimorsus]MDJ1645557.1 F0F1 ATP synthase subunit beta [Mycoplasma phocimorsus]MDJ1646600.1 F0F1 ATP synthase subunit beta [Mycoplasma phocimorsus]MDJ1647126.1 F0F1 ATP synthase subunit beta [Mycoplasma phocimorsus]MDJ1647553.1 F0F1 ATP synthase subunit beta [Mycoplasma phocimorsus]MDJ1648103.1 F0F1 ATP synthase subunit beta [Mycoplasma phocimorsus]
MAKITKLWTDTVQVEFAKGSTPKLNSILTLHNGKTYLLTKRIIDDENAKAVIIYKDANIAIGDEVVDTKSSFQVPVGQNIKGNIFSFDGKPMIKTSKKIQYIEMNSNTDNNKLDISSPIILETGIKVIDFFSPIVKGNKLGIFGGAGVGKTVLMKEIIFNVNRNNKNTGNIFIGSGERSREGVELYNELVKSNLMNNSTLFISKMNESPGARMSIVPIGVTAAEYARDVNKEDVLLFVDNMYRFIQAENEVSASLGKKPSIGGYQATLDTDIANIEERLYRNNNGSITSFQTMFLPMDDLSDPSAVSIFNHLDGNIVLSRAIAAKNIFPAIDPMESNTNSLKVDLVGQKHFDAVAKAKAIINKYRDLEDVIMILGFAELDDDNKRIVKIALQLENFFTQNFFTTEHFTNSPGVYVKMEDTVNSVIKILNGEYIEQTPDIFSYIADVSSLKTDAELKEEEKEVEDEKK